MRSVVIYPVALLPPKKNKLSTTRLIVWCSAGPLFAPQELTNLVKEFGAKHGQANSESGEEFRKFYAKQSSGFRHLKYFERIEGGFKDGFKDPSDVARQILKICVPCVVSLASLDRHSKEGSILLRAVAEGFLDSNEAKWKTIESLNEENKERKDWLDDKFGGVLVSTTALLLVTFFKHETTPELGSRVAYLGEAPVEVERTIPFEQVMYEYLDGGRFERSKIKSVLAEIMVRMLTMALADVSAWIASPLADLQNIEGLLGELQDRFDDYRLWIYRLFFGSTDSRSLPESEQSNVQSQSSSPQVYPFTLENSMGGFLGSIRRNMNKMRVLNSTGDPMQSLLAICESVVENTIKPYNLALKLSSRSMTLHEITNEILRVLSLPHAMKTETALLEKTRSIVKKIRNQCVNVVEYGAKGIYDSGGVRSVKPFYRLQVLQVLAIMLWAEKWLGEQPMKHSGQSPEKY